MPEEKEASKSKPKKKAAPKKKETSRKTEGSKQQKKKRSSEKEESVKEIESEETAEPTAPARLETEPEEAEKTTVSAEMGEAKAEEKKEAAELGEEAPVETPVEEVPAVEEEEAAEEEEEGLEIVEEKFYDLNLRRIWTAPRLKRTPRAVRYVRDFVAKRMKSDEVSMSEETNQLLWARGISKPPRHLRLRVVKDKDDRVIIFPAETATAPTAPTRAEGEEDAEPEKVAAPKPKAS